MLVPTAILILPFGRCRLSGPAVSRRPLWS